MICLLNERLIAPDYSCRVPEHERACRIAMAPYIRPSRSCGHSGTGGSLTWPSSAPATGLAGRCSPTSTATRRPEPTEPYLEETPPRGRWVAANPATRRARRAGPSAGLSHKFSSAQDRSWPPATPTASDHAVSRLAPVTARTILMGASFPALLRSVSDVSFSWNLRVANRSRTRTAKTPAASRAPGVEPRAPAPDPNRRDTQPYPGLYAEQPVTAFEAACRRWLITRLSDYLLRFVGSRIAS